MRRGLLCPILFSTIIWCMHEKSLASDRLTPIYSQNGMVVTQEVKATQVGVEILKKGGNAVDAAVAVGFALAVTLPKAGNLGGGGFMMLHLPSRNKTLALDYREVAPASASRNMYIDEHGNVDQNKVRFSHQSVAVPGTVAGLIAALNCCGTLPLAVLLQPAIKMASEGIRVTAELAASIKARSKRLEAWPATADIFLKSKGEYFLPGEKLVQSDLAWSLRQIAKDGAKGFYSGLIADLVAKDMKENEGLIGLADLYNYEVSWRIPIRGTYRGYDIVSMPPPSSGGVHLVQMLNILEGFDIRSIGHNSTDLIHLIAETARVAYQDRAYYLGDPDFSTPPVRRLISKAYAKVVRNTIDLKRARKSGKLATKKMLPEESHETTHFTIADKFGNVVSNTYTLNFSFGSGIVTPGTGILLNNQMDDFSAKPGAPNAYGLIGGEANSISASKRPLSSMTPTLVFKNNQVFMATGTPGGSRIITMILQVILNVIDFGLNIAEAGAAIRVHHQFIPDILFVESGLKPGKISDLGRRGHVTKETRLFGSVQTIMSAEGGVLKGWYGASDPRKSGALAAGY